MRLKPHKKPTYLAALKKALEVGYIFDTEVGAVFNPKGRPLTTQWREGEYPTFTIHVDGRRWRIKAHKLMAYAIWGDRAFERNVVVRHLNGAHRFTASDLALGTQSMNMLDKPPEVRRAMAKKARAAQGPSAWNAMFDEQQRKDIKHLAQFPGGKAALARLLGVHPYTITRIEKGTRYT